MPASWLINSKESSVSLRCKFWHGLRNRKEKPPVRLPQSALPCLSTRFQASTTISIRIFRSASPVVTGAPKPLAALAASRSA